MFYDTIQCPLQLVELGRSFFSSYVFPSPSFIFISAPRPSCDINDAGCCLKTRSSLSQQLCKETKAVPAVSWLSSSNEIQPFPSFSLSTFARLAKTQGTKAGHEITNQNNRQDITLKVTTKPQEPTKENNYPHCSISNFWSFHNPRNFLSHHPQSLCSSHWWHDDMNTCKWHHRIYGKSLNQEYSRFSVHIW